MDSGEEMNLNLEQRKREVSKFAKNRRNLGLILEIGVIAIAAVKLNFDSLNKLKTYVSYNIAVLEKLLISCPGSLICLRSTAATRKASSS